MRQLSYGLWRQVVSRFNFSCNRIRGEDINLYKLSISNYHSSSHSSFRTRSRSRFSGSFNFSTVKTHSRQLVNKAPISRSGTRSSTFYSKMAGTVVNAGESVTKVLHVADPLNGDKKLGQGTECNLSDDFETAVQTTSSCLLNGGVIAVPTDTIYGIAGLAQNINAVNRIYDIKRRNVQNPVAISVGTIEDIFKWSKVTVPRAVLQDLLPGPVTVVFERSPELNPALNPHTSLVGIRIPAHRFMQQLTQKCAGPVALTSANVSGATSCLQTKEFENLWPQLDIIVNGGTLHLTEESRKGSTVVDLSLEGSFCIIRPGSAHVSTCEILQGKYGLQEVTKR